MTWKSADEVAASYRDCMGEALGALFHALSTQLTWLHWEWRQFRVLFGDKPSRIDLLNEAAPFFVRIVQDLLFEQTVLGIARLARPASTGSKQNLAITRLPLLMRTPQLSAAVTDLIEASNRAASFAFDWRNRHIAHRDLPLALGTSVQPLAEASRRHVDEALAALVSVMNAVETDYCRATTAYNSSPTVQDAESLLYCIRDGLQVERERHEKWDRGEIHPDDLHPPPAV